jgi:hypothetical protein
VNVLAFLVGAARDRPPPPACRAGAPLIPLFALAWSCSSPSPPPPAAPPSAPEVAPTAPTLPPPPPASASASQAEGPPAPAANDACEGIKWTLEITEPKDNAVIATTAKNTMFRLLGKQTDYTERGKCRAWILLQPVDQDHWWPQKALEEPGAEWTAAAYLHGKPVETRYALGVLLVNDERELRENRTEGVILPANPRWAHDVNGTPVFIHITERCQGCPAH